MMFERDTTIKMNEDRNSQYNPYPYKIVTVSSLETPGSISIEEPESLKSAKERYLYMKKSGQAKHETIQQILKIHFFGFQNGHFTILEVVKMVVKLSETKNCMFFYK